MIQHAEKIAFREFCMNYPSEEKCFDELFRARWPEGFRCPRCDHSEHYRISTRRLPLFECRSCRAQTSLISGTIMEGSRTPLHLWFQAIYLHARMHGVNARQLSEYIGVTYKTAWHISHKIRHAMSQAESERLLFGTVRVTGSVYCKRLVPTFQWHPQEQPLLVGSTVDAKGDPRQIVVKVQSKLPLKDRHDSPDPVPFIRKYVHPSSVRTVNFTQRYGPKRNSRLINIGYEATWWIASIYRGIGTKHLQRYLDQFCYLYNRPRESRYSVLFADCATRVRLSYADLVGSTSATRSSSRIRTNARSGVVAS